MSPALAGRFLITEPPGKPLASWISHCNKLQPFTATLSPGELPNQGGGRRQIRGPWPRKHAGVSGPTSVLHLELPWLSRTSLNSFFGISHWGFQLFLLLFNEWEKLFKQFHFFKRWKWRMDLSDISNNILPLQLWGVVTNEVLWRAPAFPGLSMCIPLRKKACVSITWQIRNCCFSFACLFDVYGNCLWNLCNLTFANKRGHHGRLRFIYKNCRKWKAAAIIKGLWMSRIWNTTFIIIRFLQSHLPWPYFKNLTKFPQSHSLYFNKYFLN